MYRRSASLLAVAAGALIFGSCSRQDSEQVQSFDLGHRVSLGHLTYTAFDAQWHPQLGSGSTARVPQYRFLVVRLSVANGGSEEMLIPNLTIADDKGNTHEELNDGEGVANWVGYVRRAKPAESLDGTILFDAPPQHYRLKVTDENGDRAAYIDLPLSFGAELPEMPTPIPQPPSPPKK